MEAGIFNYDFCRSVESDDETVEDGVSNRESEYCDEEDDLVDHDDLSFNVDDADSFVGYSIYFLQNPKSAHFMGLDAEKLEKTRKLISGKTMVDTKI